MKFLIDAHNPPRLAVILCGLGHDAVHVSTMPAANATTDGDIIALADLEDRVVVTKDRDFRNAQVISGQPTKLLHVTTGNLSRNELIALFLAGLPELEKLFAKYNCVELNRTGVTNCA